MSQKRLLLSFSLILLAALQPTRLGAAKEPGHSSQNGRQTPAAKTTEPKVGEAPPTLEQILDKYVQALGGKAALLAPTSSVMKGTIEAPATCAKGTIEIYAKPPDKLLTEVALAVAGNPRTGFNGAIAWQEEHGEVKELTVYPKRDADFYLPLKLLELFPRIELKGKERLGAREVYRLEAPRLGNPRSWYFDTESGLLLRVETRNSEGNLLSREDYEDYRAVDGIQFPFTTRRLDRNQTETVIKYNEIKHNVPLDDTKFDMPAAKPGGAAPAPQTKPAPQIGHKAIQQDRVIAGGPKDFMEVRYLALKGSNEEIGQALAIIAKERYRLRPMPSSDRFRTRVARQYIKERYPILFERMRGVAAAFGRQIEDDAWDFNGLMYSFNMRPGCSVVYYPPEKTADGNGVVSRNYDFSTGALLGEWPARGKLAATARPYLIELRPDRGYASLALYSYDLLNGVLDGINSEGLTVTVLSDDELSGKFGVEPAEDGVGLGMQQTLRLLLDTCATVEEAKEALLPTKQYYELSPVHYLIADRHGKAFVWEYSQFHNREYIIENPKEPLITTNFSLHRYLDGKKPPSARQVKEVCLRYCSLAERIAARQGERLTLDFIKENQQAVSATEPSPQGAAQPPTRTLWHALYVPERRAAQISFYLRDEADPAQTGKIRIVRSDYLEFSLAKGVAIDLGDALFAPDQVGVTSLAWVEKLLGHPMDGILGGDFIRRYVVEIDYAGKALTLYEPKTYHVGHGGANAETLALKMIGVYPCVSVRLKLPRREALDVLLGIDTGGAAAGGLSLNSPFVTRHKLIESMPKVFPGFTWGLSGESRGVAGRAESLTLGRTAVLNPIVGFSQATKGANSWKEPNGILGSEIWRRFRVTLDYSRKQMRLEPNDSLLDPFESDMSGLTIVAEGADFKTLRIFRVRPNSPAASADLRVGDVLFSLDDQPVSTITLFKAAQMLQQDGREILVEVRRGAEQLQVRFKLKRQI